MEISKRLAQPDFMWTYLAHFGTAMWRPPSVNGVAKPRMRIKATATGLMLCPQGITVSFR